MSWLGKFFGFEPPGDSLAAAALVVQGDADPKDTAQPTDIGNPRRKLLPGQQSWQREVWDFYDSLGMYTNAVTWKSDMLSRCRLRAGQVSPDRDEPTILNAGPAADLMNELAGGPGKQSQMISSLAVYLTVPGEGYLIGETINGRNRWQVRSCDEVRLGTQMRKNPMTGESEVVYEIIDERMIAGTMRWRALDVESLAVRIWRPHKRWYHQATSSSRSARSAMRELELSNRHIAAQYMSRLASAGIVVFPEEVTFPVRPEFADAPDPFVAEWIETAAQAIKTPGTAAAVVPIPIRVPGEYVEKIRHIDFTQLLDRQIVQKRESATHQLAVMLDIPPEALLGLGGANHWTGWLIDEQGFKVYLAPDLELICDALTTGYLHPLLRSMGESTDDIVVWYDSSELLLRPDRSQNAMEAYDRLELSGKALRRELGMDEDDMPTNDELGDIVLKFATKYPLTVLSALTALTGRTIDQVPLERETITAPAAAGQPGNQPNVPTPADGQPAPDQKPRTPPAKAAASDDDEVLTNQAGMMHAIRVNFNGDWTLLHPQDCAERQFSCPVTLATWGPLVAMPGMSGVYECWLSPVGQPTIGSRVPKMNADDMIQSTLWQKGNRSHPSLTPVD